MDRVIMLCGPAASGKSYYAKSFLNSLPLGTETAFFSPDQWLENTSDGAYNWTDQRAYKAWSHEYQRFTIWMLNGHLDRFTDSLLLGSRVAIWDATFILASTRSPVLNFAKGFGLQVEAVSFQTEADECLWRNSQRPVHRRVPDEKIREMTERFAKYAPTLEEGFDRVTPYSTPRLRP